MKARSLSWVSMEAVTRRTGSLAAFSRSMPSGAASTQMTVMSTQAPVGDQP